jgi:hypothetical protein
MITRVLASFAFFLAMAHPAAAGAQTAPPVRSAGSLFDEAEQLRDEGQVALACTRFAQSQAMSMEIGVTLHLADCFERLGRTASAWTEFRMGEKLARERGDGRREAVAHAHAAALEPKLTRLALQVAPALRGRSEMRLDGERMPVEAWNLAWPVDPGDHVVIVNIPGQAPRVLRAHVEVGAPPVILRVDDPDASSVAAGPLAAAPRATPPPVDLPPPAVAPSPDAAMRRRWASLALAAAGVVGLGVGAACLVAKNHSMSNGGPSGSPHEDDGAAVGSALGFVGGGSALVSAVVLYLMAPAPQGGAWRATPAPLLGGAGLLLGTQF